MFEYMVDLEVMILKVLEDIFFFIFFMYLIYFDWINI